MKQDLQLLQIAKEDYLWRSNDTSKKDLDEMKLMGQCYI